MSSLPHHTTPVDATDAVSPAPQAPRQPRINLRDPIYRNDPHPAFHALRARERVSRDRLGSWLLLHHEDVAAAMRSKALSRHPWRSSLYRTLRPFLADSTLERSLVHWVMYSDPPQHTRIRAAMNAAFKPPVIAAMRARIEAMTHRLLDAWTGDTFDAMAGLAQPLPMMVMCDLLGLPLDETTFTRDWLENLVAVFEPEKARDARVKANESADVLLAHMAEHLARHRREGHHAGRRDSVLGHLIAAQDEHGTLSAEELLANLLLLFIGGIETTVNALGTGIYLLLRHPDQLALARAQPELWPQAVEEVLRHESPVALSDRYTIEPYTVGDVTIPAGQVIYVMLGAANRDPAVYPDPDRFDIQRPAHPHLAFGVGIHYCIGAPLARLEAEVAWQCLWQRFPQARLVDEVAHWRPYMNLRGLERLVLARS